MSLRQKYQESNYKEITVKVVIPILAEFFTMILHTFWGSMVASPTKDIDFANLNR